MVINLLYQKFLVNRTVCTDTRKIVKGCIYFALKGENFDGNDFAVAALKTGADWAVVDKVELAENERFVFVENVLETLQKLALHHRQQLNIPIIAITGSNGKTTTKELLFSVLSQHYKTQATIGNLNNHIGVPLSILSISDDTDMAIIEMGANHQNEIAFLCSIVMPT
ncbi:MAG: UDP-N-acetylmuramoyl-tripeptide--D-alanyl-D-alanine ligase, partial [Flavobacterium sp.]|nr:UDP-N-acetylmuramoyl-tripeptide--D-alanyl-D-alanine ligase [Pedobacter sp.]